MNAAERLAIIRAKARRSEVPAAEPKPKPKERYYIPFGSTRGFSYNFMGELRPDKLPRFTDWLKKPDKMKPKPCAPKRVKRVHHLTKISEQLPIKLPKLF